VGQKTSWGHYFFYEIVAWNKIVYVIRSLAPMMPHKPPIELGIHQAVLGINVIT